MNIYAIYHTPTETYLALMEQGYDHHNEPVVHLGFVENIEDALQGTFEVMQMTMDIMKAFSPSLAKGVKIVSPVKGGRK